MNHQLYDEFGNYLGESSDSSSNEETESLHSDENEEEFEEKSELENQPSESIILHTNETRSIVLNEHKQYYPEAEEVYGEDVEIKVMEEDEQTIETPIIMPIKKKVFSYLENTSKEEEERFYTDEFIGLLMANPLLLRNIAVIGDLHHGKTLLMDMLWKETRMKKKKYHKEEEMEVKYTDIRKDEHERKISIKSTPMSLVLQSMKGKSYLFNLMDCPGHVNFNDETIASLQTSDGVFFVVDIIEGVLMNTENLLKQCIQQRLPMILILNKCDRLMIELKLPPLDAYYKLLYTIEQLNALVRSYTLGSEPPVLFSPEKGNVAFASSQHGWCFTLESFSQLYTQRYPGISPGMLSQRLWGDYYYSPSKRMFVREIPYESAPKSFVQFILEPMYKIYSHVLGKSSEALLKLCFKELQLKLRRDELALNPKPLLRLVLSRFIGSTSLGLVDAAITHIPSPVANAKTKLAYIYQESTVTPIKEGMVQCKVDESTTLMCNITKLYSTPDGESFFAYGRIYSGVLKKGEKVTILGESYTSENDEEQSSAEIEGVYIPQGRYMIEVTSACAGNCVLIKGIDQMIHKTATMTNARGKELRNVQIFQPLKHMNQAIVKLAVEPLNPSELPKMLEALRKINKSFPLAKTEVEESGEHVILCTGELAGDVILHDLRRLYADIEIKVADPVTSFCETVLESSSMECYALSPNQNNRITMLAESLDKGLAQDIEENVVSIKWDRTTLGNFFQTKYNWDLMAARSIWAFGPEDTSPNILVDDTLSSEVNKSLLYDIKHSIIQGFQWGCREGPLCDEPIRNTKFKVLNALIANEKILRGSGQIIPTTRRAIYSSFLTATPRLMEPISAIEILCPADLVSSLPQVLTRRRGHIIQDTPIPGTPLYVVRGYLPVIESFGFETDLRVFTQGQAYVTQCFHHWEIVPGDPLDSSIVLHPLEPSPVSHLARDFMMKTRKRKGLSAEINMQKYFDDIVMTEKVKEDIELNRIL